ncbi:MAG TPA: hypothetical protein PLP17_02115 [Oligoflexia bacterium]|nr:hypothetical protein [Oligoflexia bacterium]
MSQGQNKTFQPPRRQKVLAINTRRLTPDKRFLAQELLEVEVPQDVPPGCVQAVGGRIRFCGTDLHGLRGVSEKLREILEAGEVPQERLHGSTTVGHPEHILNVHERSARIVRVGPGVSPELIGRNMAMQVRWMGPYFDTESRAGNWSESLYLGNIEGGIKDAPGGGGPVLTYPEQYITLLPEGLDLYHGAATEPFAMSGKAIREGCAAGMQRRRNTFGQPDYPLMLDPDSYVPADPLSNTPPPRDEVDKVRPCALVVGSGITAWGAAVNFIDRGFNTFLKGKSRWPDGHRKLKLAALLGVTIIDPDTPIKDVHRLCPMHRYDIIMDASGDIQTCVDLIMTAQCGTVVCLFTIPGQPMIIPTDWGTLLHNLNMKHIVPVPSVNGNAEDYAHAAELLLKLEREKPEFFDMLYDCRYPTLDDMADQGHLSFEKVMAQYHDFPVPE